jgi:hypothetical protein
MISRKPPWTPKAPIPDLRRVANPTPNGRRPPGRRGQPAEAVAAQADRLLRDLMATEPPKSE